MNIIKYLQKMQYSIADHAAIKSDLNTRGINVSYETETDDFGVVRKTRRYIFSNTRNLRNKNKNISDMVVESNGVILEAPEWHPLVISTLTPKSNVDKSVANAFLKGNQYDIYQLEDGTIINLYYYNNKWTISTARGIEVNKVVFNTLDYDQILKDCLQSAGVIPAEFYDSLDKSTCYTIGFKHPDMHPFREGNGAPLYKLWFVQKVTISETDAPIVIRKSPWEYIPNQEKISFNVSNLGLLFGKLTSAYNEFANSGVVNYGYLLVAKNPDSFVHNMNYSVILFESKLMNLIRNLWYDASYGKFIKKTLYNRLDTIILNSFLDDQRYEAFCILFPQFKCYLDKLCALEVKLINDIYYCLNNNVISKNTIVDILCKKVSQHLTISSQERPLQKIRDIIHTNVNIEYYYNLSHETIDDLCENITNLNV
jgi:hypothetical protein